MEFLFNFLPEQDKPWIIRSETPTRWSMFTLDKTVLFMIAGHLSLAIVPPTHLPTHIEEMLCRLSWTPGPTQTPGKVNDIEKNSQLADSLIKLSF